MKNQEALQIGLQVYNTHVAPDKMIHSADGVHVGKVDEETFVEYIKMANMAIAKQTPLKPLSRWGYPNGDTVSGQCPKCMNTVICITPRLFIQNNWGYCKECGQRIDWSVESEPTNE